ncbi:MAG: phosphatase PAP2 family protein [Candidatus Wallbacteria bacterium]|nr:phosphatase PAP2 family protein [Candidatus Wallbacteria bacterium]
MKKEKKYSLNLHLEDYIAIGFVLVVGLMYLIVYLKRWQVTHGMAVTFYYFLFPFILVLFKEAFSYFLSDNPSSKFFLKVLRDWFPFLLILSMYYSFYDGLNHFIVSTDKDQLLADWDKFLFGGHISVWLERYMGIPYLVDWLSFCYLAFVFLMPLIAGVFYFRRDYLAFRTVMIGVVLMECIGCLGYTIMPAVGPRFAFRDWYSISITGGKMTYWALDFINFTRLPRDCFPSLHVGLTALFYFSSFRHCRWLFWCVTPVILSLWFACIFLRYHYLVDVVAGLLLAVAIHFFSVKVLEPYYRKHDLISG